MCDVSSERKHGLFKTLKKKKSFSLGRNIDGGV